jgi:AcrR family transcriptional regulator
VSVALTLFARDGYAATSVRAIAAEAGLASGLLYSHFPGKEALLHAVFEAGMADVAASFALADAATPNVRLDALVRGSVGIVREHLDFWRLCNATRAQPSVVAALGPAIAEWSRMILATLRRYLVESGSPDPEGDAHTLFAQVDGMCQHFALHPESYPVDLVAQRVVARWQRSELLQPKP